MRVLVCGSRFFRDYEHLDRTLTNWYETQGIVPTLIHGDCEGADKLAGKWAVQYGVPVEVHPADWDTYGRSAGPIRNQQMLDTGIDLVIAFPRGRAKGTKHMMKIAREAGVEVIEA